MPLYLSKSHLTAMNKQSNITSAATLEISGANGGRQRLAAQYHTFWHESGLLLAVDTCAHPVVLGSNWTPRAMPVSANISCGP